MMADTKKIEFILQQAKVWAIFSINFETTDLNRTAKASARYYAKLVKIIGFTTDQPCNNSPI